jgi:hypothetical protein
VDDARVRAYNRKRERSQRLTPRTACDRKCFRQILNHGAILYFAYILIKKRSYKNSLVLPATSHHVWRPRQREVIRVVRLRPSFHLLSDMSAPVSFKRGPGVEGFDGLVGCILFSPHVHEVKLAVVPEAFEMLWCQRLASTAVFTLAPRASYM